MAANMNDENDDPYGLRGGIAPGGVPQRAPIFRDPVRRAMAVAAAARNNNYNRRRALNRAALAARARNTAEASAEYAAVERKAATRVGFPANNAALKEERNHPRGGVVSIFDLIDTYLGDINILDKFKFLLAIYHKGFITANVLTRSLQYLFNNIVEDSENYKIQRANPPELNYLWDQYFEIKGYTNKQNAEKKASILKTRYGTTMAKRAGLNYNYEAQNNDVPIDSDAIDLHQIGELLEELKRKERNARSARRNSTRKAAEKRRPHSSNNNTRKGPKGSKGSKGGGSKTRKS